VWKPAVPDELLLEVASRWAGEPVGELEALAEGEDSRAVAFRSRANRFVLRVRRDGSGFPREIGARQLLAPVGVRVPKVLGIGALDDLAWCISERIEGRTLQQLTAREAAAVGPALVNTWRAIASVTRGSSTAGGGSAEGGSAVGSFADRPAPTWTQFLDTQCAEVDRARAEVATVLGGRLLNHAMRALERRPATMDDNRLVHFDFGSNNVMVADGDVVAVLDWDYPGWGDPLWDVATLHAWRMWLPCMDIHADCFDSHLDTMPSYRERIRYYGTHIALGALRWELSIGGEPNVRVALAAGLDRLLR
jgi:aminoglycoside phosphotransferase (APT) family kinase protein